MKQSIRLISNGFLFITRTHSIPFECISLFIASLLLSSLYFVISFSPINAQTLSFENRSRFGAFDAVTKSVALGDLDGDGDIDIVASVSGTGKIYLNQGDGNFSSGGISFGLSDIYPNSVAVGDLDGDGDIDIVTGVNGFEDSRSKIYLNQGYGRFHSEGIPFGPSNIETNNVALGDLDSDGDFDIVAYVGTFNDAQVIIYLNQGIESFPRVNGISVGPSGADPNSVALGDLDGDGDLDIVTGRSKIYLNQGSGNFSSEGISFDPSDTYPNNMALGDLDDDGDLDIVTGSGGVGGGQIIIYLNQGAGNFSSERILFDPSVSGPNSVALGDLDGDGQLDIVAGIDGSPSSGINRGPSRAYLNQGRGKFSHEGIPFGSNNMSTASVALGDLNSDGNLDIVVGIDDIGGGQSTVYLNNGTDNFSSKGIPFGSSNARTNDVAVGDLDGDGQLDIAAAFGGISRIYLNQGAGKFPREGIPLGPNQSATSIALGDLDNDDDLDIIVGIKKGRSKIYINQGAGNFPGEGIPFGLIDETMSVAVGDFNGDGQLDIIAGTSYIAGLFEIPEFTSGGQSRVYLNQGVDTFSTTQGIPFGSIDDTFSIAAGDLNGDGQLDIVAGNQNRLSRVYLNQGGGKFPMEGIPFGPGDRTLNVALGDLDSDGDLDIVTGVDGTNKIYLNQGVGKFPREGIPFGPNQSASSIALGDFNSDGQLDIVAGITDNLGGQGIIYLNQGVDSFLNTKGIPFGPSDARTNDVAVGDLDGDGQLDIAASVIDGSGLSGGQSVVYFDPRLQIPSLAGIRPTKTDNAEFLSSPKVSASPIIPIPYTLFDLQGSPVGRIEAQYSLNGGGSWRIAAPATITETLNLTTGYQVQAATTVTKEIPDGTGQSLTGRLSVSNTSIVTNIEVWLAIEHPRFEDLQIDLKRPDGKSVNLIARTPGDFTNLRTLVFAENATAQSSTAILSDTVRYQPVERLAVTATTSMTGTWQLAITDTVAGEVGILHAWGLRLDTPPARHIFHWDTFASGFFGRSDNVVVRLIAYPQASASHVTPGTFFYTNTVAGPYLRPYVATTTFPFRVQGTQIRVVGDATLYNRASSGLANATAFRLTPGNTRNADEMEYGGGTVALSTADGYIPGGGLLARDDSIAALWPSAAITDTKVITQHTPVRHYLATSASAGSLPIVIPPSGSVISTLPISDVRRIGTLQITVGLTQTPTATLALALTSPDGTVIPLITSTSELTSSKASGIYNLTFSSEGAWAVPILDKLPESSDTITLTLAPSATQQLSALQGTMINGDWTLQVTNRTTNTTGALTGWGINSKLVQLYYGSAPITTTGLILNKVKSSGVQTLTISSTLPLLIFDLDVALEWDARRDNTFLRQLETDLRSASDYLFDWTNGQVALGTITVYHDAKVRAMDYPDNPWLTADVRVYATNRLRPSAVKGGVVTELVTDTVPLTTTQIVTYTPGRIQIGAVWNRFGRSDSSLADDWPRTLAHELGHYLLFLDDNYIGLKDGLLQPVETCGGAMADHYRSDSTEGYGEFLDRQINLENENENRKVNHWDENCTFTLSQQRTGRSDWETIKRFYPILRTPGEGYKNEGPRTQPLGITQITYAPLPTDATSAIESVTLDAPYYFLLDDGKPISDTRNVRLFLLKAGRQWLVDLGRLQGRQINARGAQVYINNPSGTDPLVDTLCAVRPTTASYGCLPIEANGVDELKMQQQPGWTPEIRITPQTSITLQVEVSGIPITRELHIQLFSPDFPSNPVADSRSGVVSTTFTLTTPSLRGYVVVWLEDEQGKMTHFAVSDYALGGNPALQYIWANAYRQLGDALQYVWANTNRYGDSPANEWIWANALRYIQSGSLAYLGDNALQYVWANAAQRSYAPASSNDGQVILYSEKGFSGKLGEFVTLQAMSIITATPSYATLVGDAYRLSASKGMTITDTSISMAYLTSEVNPSEEPYLRIYYSADGRIWKPLSSSRSPALNQVSAKVVGEGIYALMSSLELQLEEGWNLIGYPLAVRTEITSAVAITNVVAISVEREPELAALQVIYSYDGNRGENPWRVYGPVNEGTDQGIVNTLDVLEYGQGYQIYASEAVTLFVTGKAETMIGPNSAEPLIFNTSQFLTPPAVFVAKLASGGSLPDNVTIRAYIGAQECSQSNVQTDVKTNRHTIQIMVHATGTDTPNCAAMGQEIRFVLELNGTSYEATAPWDNRKIHSLSFSDTDNR